VAAVIVSFEDSVASLTVGGFRIEQLPGHFDDKPATRRMANGSAARPGPEGRPVVIHFKLKDAGVTSRKPATQEIRHPYEQLDWI
jgi:hypothetical protein